MLTFGHDPRFQDAELTPRGMDRRRVVSNDRIGYVHWMSSGFEAGEDGV
jgi:hypothetical protein